MLIYINTFHHIEKVSFNIWFVESVFKIRNGCGFAISILCTSTENTLVFLFWFANMVNYTNWFSNLKLIMYSWDKALLVFSLISYGCVINYLKLDSSRQQRFILWNLGGQKYKLHSVTQNHYVDLDLPPVEAPGENLFLASSSLLWRLESLVLWLHHAKHFNLWLLSSVFFFLCQIFLYLPFAKILMIAFMTHPDIIQDNLTILIYP